MERKTKKHIKIIIIFIAIAIVVTCNYLKSGNGYKSMFWIVLGMISANY